MAPIGIRVSFSLLILDPPSVVLVPTSFLFQARLIRSSSSSFIPCLQAEKSIISLRSIDDFFSFCLPLSAINLFLFFLLLLSGKALSEGIIINPMFANFFLRKLLSRYNYIDDLASLDPTLYRSLLTLKRCPEEQVEGLGLTFTVSLNAS